MEHVHHFDFAVLGADAVCLHLPDELGELGGKGLSVVLDPCELEFRIPDGFPVVQPDIPESMHIELPLEVEDFFHSLIRSCPSSSPMPSKYFLTSLAMKRIRG